MNGLEASMMLDIQEEVLKAQADLQTALGFFRVAKNEMVGVPYADLIEDRLARSLARSHRLLAQLGKPMYQSATHPDIGPGPRYLTSDPVDSTEVIKENLFGPGGFWHERN